jgi:bifunctional DNase/RNase
MSRAARAILVLAVALSPLAGCKRSAVSKRLWAPPPRAPFGYVEMKVAAVAPSADGGAVVVLGDEGRQTYLRIYIGGSEALSIQLRHQRRKHPRPLTADLLDNVMHELGGEVYKVQVDELRDNTFIGTVFVKQGERTIEIDARPSDAMALAIGNRAPIFVKESVLREAGVDRDRAEAEVGSLAAY